jgi:UDP-2,4-diacetamido-2,4,6-trideoxy-beta-L-altropyranose hydrolase
MGHVIRCLALADMLKKEYNISFAIQEPYETVLTTIQAVTNNLILLPPTTDFEQDVLNFIPHLSANDIVVLDGYHFQTNYQKKIQNKGCKLVCIDDLHAWHYVADVIINHAEGVERSLYSTEKDTKIYLGSDYALLRPSFLKFKTDKKITSVKKVFISMGAADFSNNTSKYTEALLSFPEIEEIHLMLSSINPYIETIKQLINKDNRIHSHYNISAENLTSLLLKCDLAVCPASSISLECCAVGIGLLSGYTAENQLGILKGLEDKSALINSGNMNALSITQIRNQLDDLIAKPSLLNDLLQFQNTLIDGRSPERIRAILHSLSTPIHFRFATESDADLYYKWANDPEVRKNSFNQDTIAYANHIKWFGARVTDKNYSLYLFLDKEERPLGQVRIEKTENGSTIDISIDKDFRGKSMGSLILNMACSDYLRRFPFESIYSYIKKENKASYNIFKKANFDEIGEEKVNGYNVFKLCRKNN